MPNSEPDLLLDQLFRELDDGICLSLSSGQVVYMNPAALRLLEITPAEAAEKSVCDLVCGRLAVPGAGPECASHCPIRQSTAATATYQGRYETAPGAADGDPLGRRGPRWKDIRVHCVRVQTALFDSWEPDKRLTIIEDATKEMDMERHKEDWRNMIAHDLRTPLTNIFGTLRLLEDEYGAARFEPEEAKMLGSAIRACRRMLELLNLYMDVAKLDAGLMTARLEPADLADIARRCAEEQEATAKERGIDLVVSIPAGLKAAADPDLLFRVAQNLVGNALKFTPAGGRVELLARTARSGVVEFCVADNGSGIPQEDFPRIFDRFFQAESRREGKTRGTGLGLTFCREAVLAMKGEISVQSIPGLGTQFVISLPGSKGL